METDSPELVVLDKPVIGSDRELGVLNLELPCRVRVSIYEYSVLGNEMSFCGLQDDV